MRPVFIDESGRRGRKGHLSKPPASSESSNPRPQHAWKPVAKTSRNAERDRFVGRNTEPRIIAMDKPGPTWTAIRFAPLSYQAAPAVFRKQTLSFEQIDAFVKDEVRDPLFDECMVDRDLGCFALSTTYEIEEDDPIDELMYVAPYPLTDEFDSAYQRLRPNYEALESKLAAVWKKMETRFRTAHQIGDCRVLARALSPLAEHFTALAPDAFAAFKITDWQNGIAENSAGDRIYSIHAAPPNTHDEKVLRIIGEFERSTLKLLVGQYFNRHHRNGLVGGRISKTLIVRIQMSCRKKADGRMIDEKTIRDAYKLFEALRLSNAPADLLARIEFQ